MIRAVLRPALRVARRQVRSIRDARARKYPPTVAERWRQAKADAPLRVAVIGAGRIAAAHLSVLASFEDVRLVGVANRGGERATQLASQFAIPATFTDARAMLDETAPDLVYVLVSVEATPTVARGVLARGLPCLIEKPAALTAHETAELAELAADHRTLAMVGVNRRYHSVLDHAMDAIRARGPLHGIHVEVHEPIASIRAQGRFSPAVLDRWMAANSVHMIDLIRRCAGEVASLEILATGDGGERVGWSACLRTEGGTLGTVAGHWRSTPGVRLVLHGEGVRAELDPLERGILAWPDGRREPIAIDVVDQRFKPGFYAQSAALVDAVVSGEPLLPPASDLADQVATMQLVEALSGHRGAPIGEATA